MTKYSFILIIIVLSCGCKSESSQIMNACREIGFEKIIKDAKHLEHKKYSKNGYSINEWPKSFLKLNPKYIKPYMFGIFLVYQRDQSYEYGLYIVTDPKGLPVEEGSGQEIIRSDSPLYWIKVKTRKPVRTIHQEKKHGTSPIK